MTTKLTRTQLRSIVENLMYEEEEKSDLYAMRSLDNYIQSYEKDGITGLILAMLAEGLINISNMQRMYKELDTYKEVFESQGFMALVKKMNADGIEFREEMLPKIEAGIEQEKEALRKIRDAN